jgi:anti-anti-sigma factor
MSKANEVSTRLEGDVSVLDIRGDVTPLAAQPIEEAYRGVTGAGAKKILLVFAQDCYINSGGIAVLIGVLGESKRQGQVVAITGLTPHFQKVFAMVGLTKYAQIHRSEQDALERFAAPA